MMPTIKLCLKSDYIKKDGTVNVRIRITYCKKAEYYPLGIFVRPSHFNSGRISKSDPHFWMKNLLLTKFFEKATKIIFDMEMADQQFTFKKFSSLFLDENYGNQSFEVFANKYIASNKGIVASNTTRMYKSQVAKLKEFSPGLTFNDITPAFIKEFERFLILTKKNNVNTRIKTFTVFKSLLSHARDEGLIKHHALEDYKKGTIEGNREFLVMEELQQLEQMYHSGSLSTSLANVLTYFLFCCYTGIRYEDVKKLRGTDFINDQWISLQMSKTGKTVKIPITDKARALIPDHKFRNQKTFKVLSNQPTNRYLKDIMNDAGIHKHISFHCARHTFATISLDLGISLETVKEILGHTDFKTTAIYGRIRDGKKRNEMEKWDEGTVI
jgi:integrase